MQRTYGVAIIGLGAIGQRMLANMPRQGRLAVVGGWDLDPAACRAAQAVHPGLAVPASAEALIADDAVDLVYVGTPPRAHRAAVEQAIAAGKAVFCEKPLGVDLAESRALVDLVEASGLPQAVNLSLAAARGVVRMREALAAGETGSVAGLDVRLRFAAWPRPFQAHAGWLAERAEGGFVREVVSHFVYLTESLLGPSRLVSADIRYPADGVSAETHALVRLDCAGRPVTVAGSVGGVGPDHVECTLWGSARSFRLTEFYRLWSSTGGAWAEEFPQVEEPAPDSYMLQLDALVAMMDGAAHPLPDMRAALSVQERVEAMLNPV